MLATAAKTVIYAAENGAHAIDANVIGKAMENLASPGVAGDFTEGIDEAL